jgi:molybdate transport system permease protein
MLGYSQQELTALWLTLRLASATSVLLLLLATPLAYWLSSSRSRLVVVIEALVALPLVLPPTVLGFYLLVAMGPEGWLGRLVAALGGAPLAFSFTGILLGSLVYSLPFAVQPLAGAFQAQSTRLREVAATLRASPWQTFLRVSLPLARRGFVTAAVLSFAHTLGEFGVVLMLGGSIPGQTETASIAIFRQVETLDYAGAQRLSLTLVGLCFVLLLATYRLQRATARQTVLA